MMYLQIGDHSKGISRSKYKGKREIILHNFRKKKKYLSNTDQIHFNHHLKFALSRYSLGKHNDGMISGHA